VANPWARRDSAFNKDLLQRGVVDARQVRQTGRGDVTWNSELQRVQTELREFDAIIRRSHEQRRPGESGSPRTQGKDTAEGLAARASIKLADGLTHTATAGKQKLTTLASTNPGAHHASFKDLAGTFDAVLAVVLVFRVWVQRHLVHGSALATAQRKAERLKAAVEQLVRKLR
jgi:hypothetical protein